MTPVSLKNRNNSTESLIISIHNKLCITALAFGNALNAKKMFIHFMSWSSMRIRRVCHFSLMFELTHCPMLLNIRATIVVMGGQVNLRQWEGQLLQQMDTSDEQIVKVSLRICFFHTSKQVDNKRLAIDLSAERTRLEQSR